VPVITCATALATTITTTTTIQDHSTTIITTTTLVRLAEVPVEADHPHPVQAEAVHLSGDSKPPMLHAGAERKVTFKLRKLLYSDWQRWFVELILTEYNPAARSHSSLSNSIPFSCNSIK